MKLKTTTLNRFVKLDKGEHPKFIFSFVDETGKISFARYKLYNLNLRTGETAYRLDARSVRYMKRVRIIENTI